MSRPMTEAEAARGRRATTPAQIPAKGWRDVGLRSFKALNDDSLSLVAAGVAFYSLLALFPGLTALVSLYGLVLEPSEVATQIGSMASMLPADARAIIEESLRDIANSADSALGIGLVVGIAVAVWSASKAMRAMVMALNIVYHEREQRGFLRLTMLSLVATLVAVLGAMLSLALLAGVPVVLGHLGLGETGKLLVSIGRWPLLAMVVMTALALLYRYAPSRANPRWQWVSWGAVGATLLWLGASALFTWYVSSFGNYNETYGAIGAVVVLMLWLFLSAFLALVGAEVNSQFEHQTRVDTTTGSPQPMGERGAHVADTLGKVP